MISVAKAQKLSSSQSLHQDKESLFSSGRNFTLKHTTPYGHIYLQHGRGHKLPQGQAFLELGHGLRLMSPAARDALRDLIDRAHDPVLCVDAEAELTSLSAAKLGRPDFAQVCSIAVRMKIIPQEKAGMLYDALEGLYFDTEQESRNCEKRAKDRKGSTGVTQRERTDFGGGARGSADDSQGSAEASEGDDGMLGNQGAIQETTGDAPSTSVPPSSGPSASAANAAPPPIAGPRAPASGGDAPSTSVPPSSGPSASAANAAPPPIAGPRAPASGDRVPIVRAPPSSLPTSSAAATAPSSSTGPEAPEGPKKRGRPKGSGNRPTGPPVDLTEGRPKRQKTPTDYNAMHNGGIPPSCEDQPSDHDEQRMEKDDRDFALSDEEEQESNELFEKATVALQRRQRDVNEIGSIYNRLKELPEPRPNGYKNLLGAVYNAWAEFFRD